ncbi:MAG: C25 family cysteine peptidase, partial [Bacteroidota bacterium]
QNNLLQDISLPPVGGQFLDQYASVTQQSVRFLPAATNISLQFQLSSNAGAVTGWIDWLELFARRQLSFAGSPFCSFRDTRSVSSGAVAGFEIQQAPASGGAFVWDVTNPFIPVKMNSILSGTVLRFSNDASVIREYAAGIPGNLPEPIFTRRVDNQNLHNSSPVQMLIITHSSMLSEARRLGDHHVQKDGISYVVATTDQIYHEFAGGQADPVALRDWVKMYYDKYRSSPAQKPAYLLLMGAGTYDYRGRKGKGYNLVPVYESSESLHPLFSYTSD